jgi:hypothetical protein
MTLPDFTPTGDLPVGIHQATLDEVVERFGGRVGSRSWLTQRLQHVYDFVAYWQTKRDGSKRGIVEVIP